MNRPCSSLYGETLVITLNFLLNRKKIQLIIYNLGYQGSIYCLSWSYKGNLLATGSNDKTVKLMKYNSETNSLEGGEKDLTMHDGTVRDCCFVEEGSGGSSLLLSGGAGDCKE